MFSMSILWWWWWSAAGAAGGMSHPSLKVVDCEERERGLDTEAMMQV
jgi:hypothetical protein